MKYSENGLNLTMEFEGCKLESYPDSGGVFTIGYGHTKGVNPGQNCTIEDAKNWLSEDVSTAENCVNNMVHVELTQNQFDALVDFVFNLGSGHFIKSSLLRILNSGNYDLASMEFQKWDLDDGVVSEGLARRRMAEKNLFLKEN